nr:hypothetical protein [Tanacetum cinerariifolium]
MLLLYPRLAKYVSVEKACQQALWMNQALIDYNIRLDDILIIYDNKGAIDLSKNPIQHSRTKQIKIRHHFLRDNVQKGNISIKKVSSEDNIADILTKPLKRESFNYLLVGLGMVEHIPDLKVKNKNKVKKNDGDVPAVQETLVENLIKSGLASKIKNIDGKIVGKDAKIRKPVHCVQFDGVVEPTNSSSTDQSTHGAQTHVYGGSQPPKSILKKPKTTNMGTNVGNIEPSNPDLSVANLEAMSSDVHINVQSSDSSSDTNTPTSFVEVLNDARKSGKEAINSLDDYSTSRVVKFRQFVNDDNVENSNCFLSKSVVVMGLERALQRGPWMIRNSPILLSNWSSKLSLKKGEVNKVPVWVKLFNVPVLAYSGDGLSLIATQIGKPVMLDAFISSMCVNSWGRISFARVLIEISVESALKHEVVMAIQNEDDDGYTREVIRVEFEWKPPHCMECKCFGHDPDTCPKRVKDDIPKAPPRAFTSSSAVDNKDGFTTVSSRKKKKKSGPNRLSGINLSKCNPNLKYRLVSQPGKGKGDASQEAAGPNKGLVKENGSGNLVHIDEVVPTQNSFVNLREEEYVMDEGLNVSSHVNADEASSSKSKFTGLDDDEEVYMPDGIHGGGFMDVLEDDLDCYDGYGTQVYDLTP